MRSSAAMPVACSNFERAMVQMPIVAPSSSGARRKRALSAGKNDERCHDLHGASHGKRQRVARGGLPEATQDCRGKSKDGLIDRDHERHHGFQVCRTEFSLRDQQRERGRISEPEAEESAPAEQRRRRIAQT